MDQARSCTTIYSQVKEVPKKDRLSFKTASGEVRCEYSSDALPKTAGLLSRALTIRIAINMDEQIPKIIGATEKAAEVI